MDPISRAIWYIEHHFTNTITLEDVANCAGVSRFHLSRAFGLATGTSVMRYLRARRLTQAAYRLAQGAPEILPLAIDSGYNSHEAFTRAFRDEFGITPEALRAQPEMYLETLALVEALKMSETQTQLAPPRFQTHRPIFIGGISKRYNCDSSAGIPAQWQEIIPHLGHIPGQVDNIAYGVCYNGDGNCNFDYLCGVEINESATLPANWSKLQIPEYYYAVFRHSDHIASIRGTWNAIFTQWLPHSNYELLGPLDFERYDENFNSETGTGGLEIWIPVKHKTK